MSYVCGWCTIRVQPPSLSVPVSVVSGTGIEPEVVHICVVLWFLLCVRGYAFMKTSTEYRNVPRMPGVCV